ncbi:hypothetical protein C0Q70_17461 [Pomacea canaliculata]|uniref:NTR domain-containing protein n=1 Tax=Pomacea canaliculata TaxID=400727 RepID=A0A2T7NKG5_POMCA|nr:hypothetical protein C0Q70_17461 [Pomacea canaliculata]
MTTSDDHKIVLPGHQHFSTTVSARYVFGKPVKGHATLTFGLIWHGHVFSLGKKRNMELNDTGQVVVTIPVSELRLPVESVWFPTGGRLHLEAAVTEFASGKVARARDTSVVFAESLHVVKFTRSMRHFRPGLTYSLRVDVIKANGEASSNLPLTVTCEGETEDKEHLLSPLTSPSENNVYWTDSSGHLVVDYFIASDISRLLFKVTVQGEKNLSTTVRFGALPFKSPSGTFLQVTAEPTLAHQKMSQLGAGDYITVTAHYTSSRDLHVINLLVLSRGHVVWQTRTHILGANSTYFYFPVTRHMLPAARILVFSILGQEQGSEVVSDSVWVDLKQDCYGEVKLGLSEDSPPLFRPGDVCALTVSGLPHMRVGVLAVDMSVYHLSQKTFTRSSVFDELLKHDQGCGYGGGDSSASVFQNAGLAVMTNAGLSTNGRAGGGCSSKAVRRRRQASPLNDVCCTEGFKMELTDARLCYAAAKEVKRLTGLSECAQYFFRCCLDRNRTDVYRNSTRGRIQGSRGELSSSLEVSLGSDGQLAADDFIPLRSNFPESWLFDDYTLGPSGRLDLEFALPHSVTTWVFQALGVSSDSGLCVAPPTNLTTFTTFFLQVDLPYSAVRLEQLEVRVTVYNYLPRLLEVDVWMQSVEGICYSGEPGQDSEKLQISVQPHDAASVYFPIVPLELGKFPIRVFAKSRKSWAKDAVQKILRVEGEGLEKIHTVSVLLDPTGKRFYREKRDNHTFSLTNKVMADEHKQEVELDLDLPSEVIPDTESCTVSAMGDLLGPTVRGVVDGVEEILRMPTGCGEQNLIYLGPNVYVMRYLKATGRLSSNAEKKARAFVRQGLMRQMTFRKEDGSFGTWPHAPSSTWLTAFAMKVLCQTSHFVEVDINATCSSLQWLRTRQNTDGSFVEDVWVTHREMLGGVNGDISVTAFVLIAMLECPCPDQVRSPMVDSAVRYLEHHLEKRYRPLTTAVTAYALALAGSPKAKDFNNKLLDMTLTTPQGLKYWGFATDDDFEGEQDKPYWYVKKPGALAVETTAYALLTQLTLNDVTASNPIVSWLLQQREEHGSFVSTQDTVIALQALSEYSIKSFSAVLDMTCHLRSEVDEKFQKTFSLTREDALVLKSVPEVPTGGKLHFEASGTGVGVMHVDVRFNVPHDDQVCRFELFIVSRQLSSMLQQFFWQQRHHQRCEPCSLDCDDDEPDDAEVEQVTFPAIIPRIRDKLRLNIVDEGGRHDLHGTNSSPRGSTLPPKQPNHTSGSAISRVGSSPLSRSRIGRPRRSAMIASSARVLCMEVCVRYKGVREAGMSVLDVGLFTGYQPITEDLEKLKAKGKIDHYEISQRSVIFYLSEISHVTKQCVKFRAKQNHVVENLQPAKVQVYDYYNPDERCSRFYKSENASGSLANFCDDQKRICQCLEGRCGNCEDTWHDKDWQEYFNFACNNATNEKRSVFKVRVVMWGLVCVCHVTAGRQKVNKGDKVVLLKRNSCVCPLMKPDTRYLLMLHPPKRFKDVEGNQVYVFLLDKKALVLEWPNPGVKGLSQALRQQERKVKRVTRRLARRGCQGQAQGQGQGQTGKNKEKVKGKSKPRELTKRKRKGLRAELRRKGRSGRE